MQDRIGALEMFVLYVNDDVAKGVCDQKIKISNILVVLTCSIYLVYDDRSVDERSRTGIDSIIANIINDAYRECDIVIDELIKRNDKKSLISLSKKLANNQCKQRIEEFLKHNESNKYDKPTSKIEI